MKPQSAFTPLRRLTVENLRQMVDRLERRRGRATDSVSDTRGWPKARLVGYLEAKAPPERQKPLPRVRKQRMPKNLGVAKFCYGLLAVVTGHTEDKLPIGLSYNEMVKRAQAKFPDSCVDERHLRWYASKMRRENHVIPSHRGRSKWI